MSKAIGPGRIGSVRRFIKILSELVATLPSTEEKQKIFDSLVALTNYLQSAKQNLAQIPTRDDMQQLTIVLEQFERLITRAEDNPLISKALGVEKKNKKKKASLYCAFLYSFVYFILFQVRYLEWSFFCWS